MLVGACGRRLGNFFIIHDAVSKTQVVKKRDEADSKKSVSSRLLFSSMTDRHGAVTSCLFR
ncbi:hypothetical protein GA0071314_3425 [Halomonas sp. HL-93]|nr:hypothetical protein GA0071314_3425 [Halomonas sp. HL-93]SNY97566.1 hypothetical protein SAMN04488142_2164 [Halomonas sp. hl-4]